jgi:hypothetical protein
MVRAGCCLSEQKVFDLLGVDLLMMPSGSPPPIRSTQIICSFFLVSDRIFKLI